MAGIYIHIPFCRQACHYCNFHFAVSLKQKDELLVALLKETELSKNYLGGETIETIYFGGGTPSLLSIGDLQSLLEKILQMHPTTAEPEITLEVNPDDITAEMLQGWKETGCNRLSIGIQSFFDEDLQWMNRAHDAGQAAGSLQLAIQYFENISIDLIYGMPQLTDEKWQHNVTTAVSYGIPHLSCYALTVEPKTPLDKMIRQHKTANTDAVQQARQFLLLMEWLDAAGFEHYEISNFARPGRRSRHNSSYWERKRYIGIGPSAHSFNGDERQWNISNNTIYISSLEKGEIPFQKETLTATQKLNEYIMTSLRTMEGLQLNKVDEPAGRSLLAASKKYIDSAWMKQEGDALILTREGKLLADGIAAGLFF